MPTECEVYSTLLGLPGIAMPELLLGLAEYFVFYTREKTHQSLDFAAIRMSTEQATDGGASAG